MTEQELQRMTKAQLIERLLQFERGERNVKNHSLPLYFGTFYSDVPMKPFQYCQGTCMACVNGTCTRKESHT